MTSRPYLAPGQRLYLARDPQSPRPRSTEPAALGFVQTAETIRVQPVPPGQQPPPRPRSAARLSPRHRALFPSEQQRARQEAIYGVR